LILMGVENMVERTHFERNFVHDNYLVQTISGILVNIIVVSGFNQLAIRKTNMQTDESYFNKTTPFQLIVLECMMIVLMVNTEALLL